MLVPLKHELNKVLFQLKLDNIMRHVSLIRLDILKTKVLVVITKKTKTGCDFGMEKSDSCEIKIPIIEDMFVFFPSQ